MAFSPDGRSLLTASRDGTVRIWSVPVGIGEGSFLGGTAAAWAAHSSAPTVLYVGDGVVPGSHRPALGSAARGARLHCSPVLAKEAVRAGADTRGLQFGRNEDRNRVR